MICYRVRSAVLTDNAHSFQYVPTLCRGHRQQGCFVSQADKSVCELALIQGRHVSRPYDVARSTLPRLGYLSADDWLVAV